MQETSTRSNHAKENIMPPKMHMGNHIQTGATKNIWFGGFIAVLNPLLKNIVWVCEIQCPNMQSLIICGFNKRGSNLVFQTPTAHF